MKRECFFNSNAARDPSYGYGSSGFVAVLSSYNDAFERLNSGLVTLFDLLIDLYGPPGFQVGVRILSGIILVEQSKFIHNQKAILAYLTLSATRQADLFPVQVFYRQE